MKRVAIDLGNWTTDHPRHWSGAGAGVRVRATADEWTELRCPSSLLERIAPDGHALVETIVSGKAGAAGLSFGHFKDFLIELPHDDRTHLLQLEIERGAGWRLRIDGCLREPGWWTSAAAGADDLWGHELRLKVRYAQNVLFEELSLLPLAAAPEVSVLITCNRFGQRLRAALRAWSRQEAEPGSFEVIVANPASADATHAIIAAAAASFPQARIAELELDPSSGRNKGAMINRAARWARGSWVLLTDADCLFLPSTIRLLREAGASGRWDLRFGERHHLSLRQTQAVLAGAIDQAETALYEAALSSARPPERSPHGYAQFVPRSLLQAVRYSEAVNHFAHTDQIFVADCLRRGVAATLLEGLTCLHLTHPFAWYGTHLYL